LERFPKFEADPHFALASIEAGDPGEQHQKSGIDWQALKLHRSSAKLARCVGMGSE
jgi:hypothetical protein